MPSKDPDYNRKYYLKHQERFKADALEYYYANRDEMIEKQRKYTASAPRHIKRYGLSLDQYMEMFRAQDGKCAIGHQPESHKSPLGRIKWLSVDHNHTTKQIRQLLCASCNPAVGLLKDSPSRARALADYLEKHDGKMDLVADGSPQVAPLPDSVLGGSPPEVLCVM